MLARSSARVNGFGKIGRTSVLYTTVSAVSDSSGSALHGQTVLVTGAAGGIGQATAAALHRRGALVVGLDVHPAPAGVPYPVLQADLAREEHISRAMRTLLDRHGRLDALVNNAGVGLHNPLIDARTADIDTMLAVNVRAPILLAQHAFRSMISTGGGQIVNVVSTAGLRAEPGESIYSATKFALRGFTDAITEEGRLYGIRVHGIYPAGVDTQFWRHATANGPGVDPAAVFLRATDVAECIIFALESAPHIQVPELIVRATLDADLPRTSEKLERFRQ